MIAADTVDETSRKLFSLIAMAFLLSMSTASLFENMHNNSFDLDNDFKLLKSSSDSNGPWDGGNQPWPQFGKSPTRIAETPVHSVDNGGAGFGEPANATSLLPILSPSVNWIFGSYSIGTDSLGTPIADLTQSIVFDSGAEDRCGKHSLFTVLIQTVDISGSSHSMLRIVEGEDADLAWQADLGVTETVKATPVIVDLNGDDKQEIIVVFDAAGSLFVEAWSPQLSCSVTGWSYNGHSDEMLWSWSDETRMVSSDEGPYSNSILGGHKPTAQPLLADLDMDGDAELVIAAIDEVSEDPVVIALPLESNNTPSTLWEVVLDKGSHPSDPAFAQVDENTGYVLLTTIEANNGAMWAWKIESSSGDSSWESGLSLDNLDGDTNSPHVRLPGPIIVNLDSDPTPEMIVTIPTDADGSSSVDGAEFRGMEIDDGEEIWNFEASNGFADAPPTAIDTDDDGIHDRVCWVTWWQTTTGARHGGAGCHDVGGSSPEEAWNRELEQSSGNPNDEIAVSAPSWMEINDQDKQELIVAFGRTVWAFDGDSGTSSAVNEEWSDGLELDHRTWSSPSFADVDGDATLDLVIASMAVSTGIADIRPLLDGRGIEFNPSSPDPGEEVTITAFIENSGTVNTGETVDAILVADGIEIARQGISNLEPVEPSGSGSFASFSTEWSGGLGDHTFELILDPYRNLSQSRYDNDVQSRILSIVPTYNVSFEMPTDPIRVNPGSSQISNIDIRSTGRISGTWSLSVDSSNLPTGWSWEDRTPGGIEDVEIDVGEVWTAILQISAPDSALGSDSGFLGLTMSLDEAPNTTIGANLPIEANRTRGLSIRGPDGTSSSNGNGLLGEDAKAWLVVENVGNAEESQIAISWDGTAWGSDLRIFDRQGTEINALTLGPGEEKEITARLMVPSSANLGDSVETPLSMCVGTGDSSECSEVDLTFIALGAVVEPQHHRTVPRNSIEWSLIANLPLDEDNISWSISEAGMGISGWAWDGSGNLSINGDSIILSGTPGSRVSGKISLDIPENSPPSFHLFDDGSLSEGNDFRLFLSLEVMQIHRADLIATSPTSQPSIVDVNVPSVVILRLENPGNGADSFSLTYSMEKGENVSSEQQVDIEFSSNPVSLSAGSLRTVPLSITFPAETPARTPITINFKMSSLGNRSVFDTVDVTFEVRQDHNWEISPTFEGRDAINSNILVNPGESTVIEVNATNLGNMVDDLSLQVQTTLQRVPGDESSDWDAIGSSITGVGLNESSSLNVTAISSPEAWNGSKMNVSVSVVARDQTVLNFYFSIEVVHVPLWDVLSGGTNLEIDSTGSEVEISIIQLGNSPSRPYVSAYVSGEMGWEIGEIGELPIIQPEESETMRINITPPESAIHAKSVELHIRVKEGDSTGLAEITLPLRVSIVHNFSMDSDGTWPISHSGGFPMATISNLGNSPSTISLSVLGIPEGWEVSGDLSLVIGVNERMGLPLELMPSQEWDGGQRTVRILAEDRIGNQKEIILDVVKSQYSWASSPYISALKGDDAILKIHGTDSSTLVTDSSSGELSWSSFGWILPVSSTGPSSLSINQETSLDYYVSSFESPTREVSCSISGVFNQISASCIISNSSENLAYSALLISDRGSLLDSRNSAEEPFSGDIQLNLSADLWVPEPGLRKLSLRLLNEKGYVIESTEEIFEIRRLDWNVGLVGLELQGSGENQKIKVLTKRVNENLLENADCMISLKAGDFDSEHLVDMTQVYVPTPLLDRPEVEDGVEAVVKIECKFPWDMDSNSEDDEARIVLSGGSVEGQGLGDLNTGIVAALLVFGLYSGFAWILSNYRERERLMAMTEAAIREKAASIGKKEEGNSSHEGKSADTPDSGRTSENTPEEENSSEKTVDPEEELDDFEMRLRRLVDR